jgi:hypothetical protein
MPVVTKKKWLQRMHGAWRDLATQARAELKKQLTSLTTKHRKASGTRAKGQIRNSIDKKQNEIAQLEAVDSLFVAFLETHGVSAKRIR